MQGSTEGQKDRNCGRLIKYADIWNVFEQKNERKLEKKKERKKEKERQKC